MYTHARTYLLADRVRLLAAACLLAPLCAPSPAGRRCRGNVSNTVGSASSLSRRYPLTDPGGQEEEEAVTQNALSAKR